MKKVVKDDDIKKQKELEQKLANFVKVYEEINKDNIIFFNADVQKDFFVERLLYINNKLFVCKEKITIDQIIRSGGVIIPYKQGVGSVTLNQRVARLEDDMVDVKAQLTSVSTKIDTLTELLKKHIENHK